MLSIITPTYNRKNKLKRVYESLLKQSNDDFEWLIIDDGSTDDTKLLVESFSKKKFPIKYYFKENGGKPSAYNLGVQKSKGKIIMCLDSDDSLIDDAVKIILSDYQKIEAEDDIAGLVYNDQNMKTKQLIGTNIPDKVIDTYYNLYEKYQVKGDKMQVIKRNIALLYLFPIIDSEKFICEALINNRISQKYKFLYCDKALKNVEYLSEGYSANYFKLVKDNPLGNALYYKELFSFKKSLYNIYGYILFSIYGKVGFKKTLISHPAKIRIILLYLPVLIISKIK